MIEITRLGKPKHFEESNDVTAENNRAIELFAPPALQDPTKDEDRKEFEFKEYNKGDVKDVLKKMCHNKCAYCESTFLHVYYGDIEHFRPKMYVGTRGDQVRPGYYWLSNDWDNLFLSCLFCNRSIKHIVEVGKKPITIGKQNQFPFGNETLYRKPRDHNSWTSAGKRKDDNARLLINPCKDNPEEYLVYDDNGFVLPKVTNIRTKKHKKAAASINVYALQRLYLVQERRKRLVELKMQFAQIRKLLLEAFAPNFTSKVIASSTIPGETALIKNNTFNQLSHEIELLFYFTYKKHVFAGMCRQYVYEFISKELFDTHTVDNKLDKKIKKIETSIHQQLDEKYKLSGEL